MQKYLSMFLRNYFTQNREGIENGDASNQFFRILCYNAYHPFPRHPLPNPRMEQNSQQVSVSHVSAETEATVSALENAASVVTVTVAERADWTLVDAVSVGVLLVEIFVGLMAIGVAYVAFLGFRSIKEIRKDTEEHAENLAEEKLRAFRENELPPIIKEAILAHNEEARRREAAVRVEDKEKANEPN